MKKISSIIILSVALVSCGPFSNKETSDQKDSRIVALSKHRTEKLLALGKGQYIVGCDLSSTYPDSAKLLQTVGYHRALKPKGIISVNPDLVSHSHDIGPANVK